MRFGWENGQGCGWLVAAARVDTGVMYYVGLAVVVAIMIGTIIAFYRTWDEMHEDLEPDSPRELLESFREAHAAGEIDDRELERMRTLLETGDGEVAAAVPPGPRRPPSPGESPRSKAEDVRSAEHDPGGPHSS